MKLPLSWLSDFVDIGDITPNELADKLLSIGFEVEEIITPREDIKGVVVGHVDSIVRHENSDKLWICSIDIGSETVQIVTGAQNVKQGDYVPVATVGAELPGGMKLVAAKLRGVDSFGMLCSGSELCVDDDVIDGASVDGILILPDDSKVGENIMHTLGIDDTVLDVSITANRPDCQAIANLAREISILLDKPFKMPKLTYKQSVSGEIPSVVITNKDLCSYYIGRVIRDVKIDKSPKWMRDRLRLCGIRPINNLVDITNYVLLEIGQPLHAFDRKFIDGGIIVRKGKPDEKLTALDGNEYSVDDVLVIADNVKPLAIAGIMGGEYTGIFSDTREVFLEAARFERSNIRRTSRKIGLRSDSSSRYEKGVDWKSVEIGSARALALIDELKCGKIDCAVTSDGTQMPEEKIIRTTKEEICSLLGIDIDKKIIVSILKKQGIRVKCEGKTLVCTIPLVREDIESYADLAEDVMRFYGYDNIVSTHSESTTQTFGGLGIHDKNVSELKLALRAFGCDEILNYTFISPDEKVKLLYPPDDRVCDEITIKNPLGKELSVMRTQTVSAMLSSIAGNCARKNNVMRFFEIGKVFIADKLPLTTLPDERDVVSIGICNDGDFYTVKAIVDSMVRMFGQPEYTVSNAPFLHPKQSLRVEAHGISGDFGKLHPLVCENYELPKNVFVAQIDFTDALNDLPRIPQFTAISKLQPVDRDLALIVAKDVAVGKLLGDVKNSSGYITDVKLFDIYEGEQIPAGYKNIAFSVRFQPAERTFSDNEIKSLVDDILRLTSEKYGATLR